MNKDRIVKLGQLEVDLDKLTEFIVRAKKNCYAGNGDGERLPDGSKRLVFQEGDFWYEDNYDGWYQAPGRELVKWRREDGQRIWQMAYSGGMLPEFRDDRRLVERTFNFLRRVLSRVEHKKPFRGPESYSGKEFYGGGPGALVYSAKTDGDLIRFVGWESIVDPTKKPKHRTFSPNEESAPIIFSQNYMGGLIIPR